MVATPPEEIAAQHAAAREVINSRLPCAPRIDHGEVPLRWKARPTASVVAASRENSEVGPDLVESNPTDPDGSVEAVRRGEEPGVPDWVVSSRGQVDVSPIVELITEGFDIPTEAPPQDASPKQKADNRKTKRFGLKGKRASQHADEKKTSEESSSSTFSTTNLWSEHNAAKNNVKITRPSHDAWGIKKIVMVFCDDFLHTIYTFPWYQRNDPVGRRMHEAVQPILDVLGIQQHRLVRCLLAGLPPGVTIPVHHDTGEWVKHTHRIHVPVIVPDPDRVLFRCGLTEEAMERVDCAPGHVFEMNNQAKHAVTNAGDRFRVHLILDYVDASFFESSERRNRPVRRADLDAGEVVSQTRRTIDRAADFGAREHPSFLILGAQKAGTTSLYEGLNQHPWVVRARRRETHCLDWRWDEELRSTERRRGRCLSFYHAEGMRAYPSLVTGDSTPSYLLDYYRVIPRLKECFPHGPLLMIMVRDPVRRAASHYAMVTSDDGTPGQMKTRGTEWRGKSIEEVLEQDVRNMKDDGLLPYWDADAKTVDRRAFDDFADSKEEDEAWERYVSARVPLHTGSYSPLARGMYALQCRPWFRSFPRGRFLVTRLEDMESRGTQWAVDRATEHLGLPRFEVPDGGRRNAREYGDPFEGRAGLRGWLERFFAPHNERFGRMMIEEMGGDEADWRDPWRYST